MQPTTSASPSAKVAFSNQQVRGKMHQRIKQVNHYCANHVEQLARKWMKQLKIACLMLTTDDYSMCPTNKQLLPPFTNIRCFGKLAC